MTTETGKQTMTTNHMLPMQHQHNANKCQLQTPNHQPHATNTMPPMQNQQHNATNATPMNTNLKR
jgi:hypothetical protein